jgi:hypothetical protein
MPEPPEPLGVVTTYADFCAVLRRRIIDLNVSLGSVEKLAGLQPHHLTKILRGFRAFGPMSLDAALPALALKLVIMHDPEQMDRIRHRLPPRAVSGARIRDPHMPFAEREFWDHQTWTRNRRAKRQAAAVLDSGLPQLTKSL